MKSIIKLFTLTIFSLFQVFNNSVDASPNSAFNTLKDTITAQQSSGFNIGIQIETAKKGRFEVGLDLGILRTSTEFLMRYKEFSRGVQISGFKYHHSPSMGLKFTHILHKNWWLRAGFRYGYSKWSDDILFQSSYNKSGEYILPNGDIGYDLTLVASGQFAEVESHVNVSITNASSLDDGDLIVSDFLLEHTFSWFQVPIGVEYRMGKKRFNYMVEGGISLNQAAINNFNIEGLIEGSNARLLINKIEYPPSNINRFVEFYLGAGVRYNLKSNLIVHANCNLRFLPSTRAYYFELSSGLHFGVGYLF
jgi:hypothetical protein